MTEWSYQGIRRTSKLVGLVGLACITVGSLMSDIGHSLSWIRVPIYLAAGIFTYCWCSAMSFYFLLRRLRKRCFAAEFSPEAAEASGLAMDWRLIQAECLWVSLSARKRIRRVVECLRGTRT